MFADRFQEAAVGRHGAPVVQKEDALSQSPQRCGAKFVGTCGSLGHLIRQARSHVMNQKIGKQRRTLLAERRGVIGRPRLQRRRVAQVAVNNGKKQPAVLNGLRRRIAGNAFRRGERRR